MCLAVSRHLIEQTRFIERIHPMAAMDSMKC